MLLRVLQPSKVFNVLTDRNYFKTMKHIWLMMCAALSLTLFVGCKADEPMGPQPEAPQLTLAQTEVEATADGGHFEIGYELLNASAGAELKVNAEHDWVIGVDTSTDGVIKFDVSESYEPKERSCRLELIYPGVYPNPTIKVTQTVGKEHSIKLELISAAATTITMNVIPQDKEMPYVFILGNGDYIKDNGLMTDDEALWASDMDIFQSFADAFGSDVSMAVTAFMYEGDRLPHQFTGVTPGTSYVAYAYGFDRETMTPTTEISRLEITTSTVNDYTLHFDFDVKVNGPNVDIKITPEGYDGYYYYGVFWKKDVQDATTEELRGFCEADWEQNKGVYSSFFDTTEEGLQFIFNELAYSGTTELSVELDANTEFVLWAFGMNDEALLNTTPEFYEFKTGDVAASENEFTLSVTELYPRKATVKVETTNDDTYVASLVASDRFEGNTDEEIMDYILTNFNVEYASGTMSDTATGLKPNTEYELLVFGAKAGAPTTGLQRLKFTTEEVVYADLDFSLTLGDYYSGAEVAAIDSNYAGYENMIFVRITANVDAEAVNAYFNATNALDFPYYEYEQIVEGLTADGPLQESSSVYAYEYDEPYVFFGLAEDRDGNFTEVWASKQITFTEEGCSPAEEFFTSAATLGVRASARPESQLLSTER